MAVVLTHGYKLLSCTLRLLEHHWSRKQKLQSHTSLVLQWNGGEARDFKLTLCPGIDFADMWEIDLPKILFVIMSGVFMLSHRHDLLRNMYSSLSNWWTWWEEIILLCPRITTKPVLSLDYMTIYNTMSSVMNLLTYKKQSGLREEWNKHSHRRKLLYLTTVFLKWEDRCNLIQENLDPPT